MPQHTRPVPERAPQIALLAALLPQAAQPPLFRGRIRWLLLLSTGIVLCVPSPPMVRTLRRGRDRRGTLRVAFGRTLWIGRAGRIAGAWPVSLAWRRTEAVAIAIARRRPSTGDGHVTHEPLRCCRSSAITHGSISQGALGCGAHGGLGHGGLHHLGSLSHLDSRILLGSFCVSGGWRD